MKSPLVFISGLLSNQVLWEHQTRHLSDIASIQIISPNQDTPEKMIQAILDVAPPKFALAGHSMGGWLCLEVMRAMPSRVSRLCLLNTTARMDSEEKKCRRQKMILRAKQGEFRMMVEEMIDNFVFNPLVKKDVEKMFLSVGEKAFIHQEEAMLIRRESLSILPTIACPTLVIHAAQDKIFSFEEHEELANQIKGASLVKVENSGHMSPLEVPEAITTHLREWFTHSG